MIYDKFFLTGLLLIILLLNSCVFSESESDLYIKLEKEIMCPVCDGQTLDQSQSLIAENKLNIYIDDVVRSNNISENEVALVGFSQGGMISLQTALKRKKQINCLISYSGKVLNQEHLRKNINSRPEIFLMHGDIDQVVPVSALLEAKHFFKENQYKIHTKIFEKCEHRIPNVGLSIGLEFLKKNLYFNKKV